MIDTLSLLLAHLLLGFVAFRMFNHPGLDVEQIDSGRTFKQIASKTRHMARRAGVESGGDGPGFRG